MSDTLIVADKPADAPAGDAAGYHAPTKLGRTQSMTRQGFLLATGVRIARVGEQYYAPREMVTADGKVLVAPGPDGVCRVKRTADEVFAETSINSLNGATLTMGHPPAYVSPDTYKSLSVGDVLAPRRGEGADANFLIADLLVKDGEAIKAVRDKRIVQVSAGYGAEYQDLGGGHGSQHHICHDHVALVEQARCGPECSIGDHAMADDKPSLQDQFFSWFMKGRDPVQAPTADAADLDTLKGQMADLSAQLAALTATKDEAKKDQWGEDPDDKSDEAEARRKKAKMSKEEKTGDAAALGAKLANLAFKSEILAPGVKPPVVEITTDAATNDHICSCQRAALKASVANTRTADGVKALLAGIGASDIDAASATTIDAAFNAAAEFVKMMNNNLVAGGLAAAHTVDKGPYAPGTIPAEIERINAENKKRWASGSAA